eukprot:XP_011442052.2 PREDICTED: uncharacterized protein LOC105338567 isoform X2 [Crassostrea gigas]
MVKYSIDMLYIFNHNSFETSVYYSHEHKNGHIYMVMNMMLLNPLYTFSCVLLLIISIKLSRTQECGENHKCCPDFREINGTCTECIGFYGENCNTPCPSNFYGPKCKGVCNCSENETCNQFVGCVSNFTCDVGQHLVRSQQGNLLWQIGICSLAIQSLTLCLCISIVLRKRMKWRKKPRITNPGSVRDHIRHLERSSKMPKYKRKCENDDEGPLDGVPTYGQLRNGYNHIYFPKVHLDGLFSDEYSSMKDQNLRHNGLMTYLYDD